jgi:hypothetical protein
MTEPSDRSDVEAMALGLILVVVAILGLTWDSWL